MLILIHSVMCVCTTVQPLWSAPHLESFLHVFEIIIAFIFSCGPKLLTADRKKNIFLLHVWAHVHRIEMEKEMKGSPLVKRGGSLRPMCRAGLVSDARSRLILGVSVNLIKW